MAICNLCKRDAKHTNIHHLIPKCRHKNKKNKKIFSREEVKTRTVELCIPCHSCIHHALTTKELERKYNTIKALMAHEKIKNFVNWIEHKPDGTKIPFPKRK